MVFLKVDMGVTEAIKTITDKKASKVTRKERNISRNTIKVTTDLIGKIPIKHRRHHLSHFLLSI